MSIQIRIAGLLASAIVASAVNAQTAVEWKVSEGGNGHWYQRQVRTGGIDWAGARSESATKGGHLATISSTAENVFVHALSNPANWSSRFGPWLGGFQAPGSIEPGGGWQWITGEPWAYTHWAVGCGGSCSEPSNGCPTSSNENALHFIRDWGPSDGWNDLPDSGACGGEGPVDQFMVEWDADCNGDGIVDYGQIVRGEIQDDNQNGVPDICEYTVTGVIPVSGPAGGGTSIIVNGTNLPENPTVLVGGSPATNVVRVSPTRLTAVTPAGLPGMTSVTVGNWVQPNAFYYRPECGSDLDQDGEVTAADIAIVLLDFGPCYVTATSLQADDSQPFMLQEQPAPTAPRSR